MRDDDRGEGAGEDIHKIVGSEDQHRAGLKDCNENAERASRRPPESPQLDPAEHGDCGVAREEQIVCRAVSYQL